MPYATQARYDAAWLLSEGYELLHAEITAGDHFVTFTFADPHHTLAESLRGFINHHEIQGFVQAFEQISRITKAEKDTWRKTAERR